MCAAIFSGFETHVVRHKHFLKHEIHVIVAVTILNYIYSKIKYVSVFGKFLSVFLLSTLNARLGINLLYCLFVYLFSARRFVIVKSKFFFSANVGFAFFRAWQIDVNSESNFCVLGRVPPIYRGAVAICQVLFLHVV